MLSNGGGGGTGSPRDFWREIVVILGISRDIHETSDGRGTVSRGYKVGSRGKFLVRGLSEARGGRGTVSGKSWKRRL